MQTSPPAGKMQSFINAPVCTDLDTLEADIAFLGIPYGIPYSLSEHQCHAGPSHVRQYSTRFGSSLSSGYNFDIGGDLQAVGPVRIVDCGDVPGDVEDPHASFDRARATVAQILDRGAVPVVIGGTDSIPIPVARAYENHGPIVVIQIDEHLDFKDELRGIREGYSSPMRRISEMPWVSDVFQLGLYGMGSALVSDVEEALAAGHTLITEREVHEQGVQWVLDQIPDDANYMLTIDYDGFDVTCCPAVSHPEPGGLTYHEGVELLEGLARKGRIVGMDWAELVPEHDYFGLTARTTGRLILTMIRAMIESGQIG